MRRRIATLTLVAAAVAIFLVLQANWPHDQTIHFVLGEAAPRVEQLDVRYESGRSPGGDDDGWSREVSYRFAPGKAPRIVTHTTRLPNGDWTLEIDLTTASEKRTVRRHIALSGGITSLDVSEAVPK